MVLADWGVSDPPLVLLEGQLSAPQSAAVVKDLPEVRTAIEDGWYVAPDPPMWVYIPALWPRFARAWLPDRSTHYMIVSCTGQPTRRVPWTADLAADIEQDANSDLQNCGLPVHRTGSGCYGHRRSTPTWSIPWDTWSAPHDAMASNR
ncbi:MAG: hypothetical protein GEV04_11445 [Actinophytocola sp.]|nr:hypothetical protein [Actinophytocola sp.]